LTAFVEATAEKFGVPGIAVGVWADGREIHVCHGVTSPDTAMDLAGRAFTRI
jgi:hypothetical protein